MSKPAASDGERRPWWPAHYDDGSWYCDAHNTFDCGPCQAGAKQEAGERRVLAKGWLAKYGDLCPLWHEGGLYPGGHHVRVWLEAPHEGAVYVELVEASAPTEESEGSETR